jgi:hypothetical protein
MNRILLTLAAVLALAAIGCFHTSGHYPALEDKPDPYATSPDEIGGKIQNAPAPERTPALPPERTDSTVPDRKTGDVGPDGAIDDRPADAPGATRVKITRTEITRSSRPLPADDESLSKLYGTAVRAAHIVYVIDRSAATNKHWEDIRGEVIASLGDLHAQQDFAVVLMGDVRPRVGPEKGLAKTNKRNQMLAAKMLLETEAAGKTDPLSALRQAIFALTPADAKGGKVIYFITDRAMMDEAAARMFQTPAAKNIVVMTYMVGEGGNDSQQVLEKLASQSGGRFTHVTADRK